MKKKHTQAKRKIARRKNASSELNKTMKISHWTSLISVADSIKMYSSLEFIRYDGYSQPIASLQCVCVFFFHQPIIIELNNNTASGFAYTTHTICPRELEIRLPISQSHLFMSRYTSKTTDRERTCLDINHCRHIVAQRTLYTSKT